MSGAEGAASGGIEPPLGGGRGPAPGGDVALRPDERGDIGSRPGARGDVVTRAGAKADTVEAALRATTLRLRAAGVSDPATDARRLVAHALGLAPAGVTPLAQAPMPADAAGRLALAVAARAERRPMAQILGRRAFWGHEFQVTADVLDPRPETETLVATALEAPFARVLDLGTGSGCVLLSVLAERPGASGLGVDLSGPALDVARRNAAALGLAGRAAFRQGDWVAGLEERFDLILSNPPYIPAAELAGLAPEVRDWEPRLALTPGGDGLGAYRAILAGAPALLLPGGRLAVEIGAGQAPDVAALTRNAGLGAPEIRCDLDGRPRVLVAQKA